MGVKKGKGVTVDTSQLKKFSEDIQKLTETQKELFFYESSRKCAAQLLGLVIPNTPVGKSLKDKDGTTIHMGGALRRAWTCKTEEEALSGMEVSAEAHALTLPVSRKTSGYEVEIINPMHYASYVEFGHRQTPGRYVPAIGKRLVKNWVDGQSFMTNAENDYRSVAPVTLQALLDKYLKKVF